MTDLRDPPRWLDDAKLQADTRLELSQYVAEGPSIERRARMLAGLEQQLGLNAGTAAGPNAAAVASTGGKLKLLLGALGVVAAAVGLFAIWSSPSAQPLPARIPLPIAQPAVPRNLPAAETPLPSEPLALQPVEPPKPTPTRAPLARSKPKHAQTAVRGAAPVEVTSAPLPTDEETYARDRRSDPLAELALLARARRALLREPAHALEFTEQHAREYPHGTFGEEREVLAIESLVRLRLDDEAKSRRALFEQQFPNSTHRAHLTRIIATLD